MSLLSDASWTLPKIKEVFGFYSDLISGKENDLFDETLSQVSDKNRINTADLKKFVEGFDKEQLTTEEEVVVEDFYITLYKNMLGDQEFHNLLVAEKMRLYESSLDEINKTLGLIKDQQTQVYRHPQVDETNMRILKALSKFERSYTPIRRALGGLEIEEVELGDRLDSLAKRQLVQVAKGTAGCGSLPNGINNVGITGEGRTLLRERGLL